MPEQTIVFHERRPPLAATSGGRIAGLGLFLRPAPLLREHSVALLGADVGRVVVHESEFATVCAR